MEKDDLKLIAAVFMFGIVFSLIMLIVYIQLHFLIKH